MIPEITFADGTEGTSCVFPYSAHFLLNDKCNARCVFCGGNYYNSTSGKVLSLEKFRIIANNIHLEHFQQVVLAGAGDPLLSPDFIPIIECLRSVFPSVGIVITTNGIGLSRQLSEHLVAGGISSINISLNAATRTTYQRLMQVDAFDTIINQIRSFSELCRQCGKGPQLQFSIPIMRCNIEELPLLVTLAHQLGAVSVNVFYCRFYPREIRNDKNGGYLPDDESLFFHQELSDRIVLEAKQLAERLGVRLIHEPLFREGPVTKCCHWPDSELIIGFDGEIFPCGGGELHFKKRLQRGEYFFGNALQQPIEEFWNNTSYRALRISSKQGEQCLTPECRECANMVSHLEQRAHILEWQDFSCMERTTSGSAPLVSVIVPTHNRPDMLACTLQSILDQSFRDYEIIVINDAGQDVSAVIERCNASNIHYLVHDTNKGLAAARNTGLKAAQGKYIAYLDDDDIYYPTHLQTLVEFLESSDYSVAYTDACRINQRKEGDCYVTENTEYPYSEEFDADRMLSENYIPVLCIMHRATCLKQSGLFDETLNRHEDWELWIRMSRTYPFAHIKRITCAFTSRNDGSGMVSGSVPLFLRTYDRICLKYPVDEATQASIIKSRSKCRFFLLCDVYTFLLDKIAPLVSRPLKPFPDELLCNQLMATGASYNEAVSAYYLYCSLEKGTSSDQSVALLEKALEEEPTNLVARQNILQVLVSNGKHKEAIKHLELLHASNPYEVMFLLPLADYYLNRDKEKACYYLTCLLKEQPDNAAVRARLDMITRDLALTEIISKKKYIAIFSLDRQEFACPQLRLLGPLGRLANEYDVRWGVQIEKDFCITDLDAMQAADIIVVQRFYPRKGTLPFLEQVFATGKPVIYELDDLITDVPDDNHLKPWIKETADLLPGLLPRFSAITVSTGSVAAVCNAYNPHLYLLPNLIDEQLWQATARPVSNGPVVIGFAGTSTHRADLEAIEPALFRVAEKYGNRVAFRFMGDYSPACKELPGFGYIPFAESYREYAARLPSAGFDIAIIPLQDNSFNRAKSNIKWLEYSACGIAGVYADLTPYNSCITHGKTGLLVGADPEQWFQAICLLVEQPEYRSRMAENAQHEVLANHSLQSKAVLWQHTYQAILDDHEKKRQIKFSILILTWNRARMLDACLAALFDALGERKRCEVIIADNGSTDETASVVQKYAVDRYARYECNAGVTRYQELFDMASGDYLICLDDDVLELPLQFERTFEEYFSAFPDYGLLGLNVIQNQHTNGAKPDSRYYREDVRGTHTVEEGYVIGCCMCIKRETFHALGGFDDVQLTLGQADDAVLQRKVASAGLRAGIIKAAYCLHACGPNYSKQFGCLKRDIQKYQENDLPEMAALYEQVQHAQQAPADEGCRVSVIIPVFNQLHFTQQCLQALFDTLPSDSACEIIVVDNASSDGTGAYLRGLGDRVRVISNTTNLGFAKACNQGARAAQGDYLLFLNNDTVPQPGWLEPLLNAVQSGAADISGARLLYPDGRCQHAGIAFDERGLGYHIFGGFPGDAPEVTQRREMQAVTGACLMISKQLFAELEGFDEKFRNGFEDVDLCLRAGEQGKRILYLPESVVVHYAEQTPGRKDHDIPNMQRFFRRWSGKLRQDDQQLYRQFGLTCNKDQEGRFRITRDAGSVPQVSIIIPLLNQEPLTEACLSALQRCTPQGCYELILVDNASTDGTPKLLERWRHAATVIRNLENAGFARACNQGARAARGEYLLFLNNDTEVTDGWLEPLLEVLEQDASVAATGSKLLYPDGTIQHAGVLLVDDQQQGDPLVARHLYQRMPGDHPAANMLRSMQALTAACLLVRRTAFEAAGGFDEGYWNGYEDVDLCLKLAAAGQRIVYQPASVVLHHESQSGPERFSQAGANIQHLHQRWLGKVQVDAIMQADGTIQHGPGMLNGTTAIYQPPAASASARAAQQDSSARPREYQLVPLVAGSASSLMQRLSSSHKAREVLQRYTVAV